MIPLYGFLQGDSIGLLIFAYPEDTIAALTKKLQNSAAIRVKPSVKVVLKYNNIALDPQKSVAEIGFQPLDVFYVEFLK